MKIDPHTKVQVAKRVIAFTLFRHHLPLLNIARQVDVSRSTLKKWQREDEWEERRATLLQQEIAPGWADDLFEMLLVQNRRLTRMETQLEALLKINAPTVEPPVTPLSE